MVLDRKRRAGAFEVVIKGRNVSAPIRLVETFRYSKYDGLARTGCRESKVPYIDMALVSHVWWWVDYIP